MKYQERIVAMARVSSYKSLLATVKKHVEASVNDVLANEMTDTIKETISEHVQSDVYGAYNPKHYMRRGDVGGLGDIDNLHSEVGNLTLTVENFTALNPYRDVGNTYVPWPESPWGGGNLSPMIINGYSHPVGGPYNAPRPYMEKANSSLHSSGKISRTLIDGMVKRGFKKK